MALLKILVLLLSFFLLAATTDAGPYSTTELQPEDIEWIMNCNTNEIIDTEIFFLKGANPTCKLNPSSCYRIRFNRFMNIKEVVILNIWTVHLIDVNGKVLECSSVCDKNNVSTVEIHTHERINRYCKVSFKYNSQVTTEGAKALGLNRKRKNKAKDSKARKNNRGRKNKAKDSKAPKNNPKNKNKDSKAPKNNPKNKNKDSKAPRNNPKKAAPDSITDLRPKNIKWMINCETGDKIDTKQIFTNRKTRCKLNPSSCYRIRFNRFLNIKSASLPRLWIFYLIDVNGKVSECFEVCKKNRVLRAEIHTFSRISDRYCKVSIKYNPHETFTNSHRKVNVTISMKMFTVTTEGSKAPEESEFFSLIVPFLLILITCGAVFFVRRVLSDQMVYSSLNSGESSKKSGSVDGERRMKRSG